MKLYKLKDMLAIPFFFVIICLLNDSKNIPIVKGMLFLGALGDFIVSVSDIGEVVIFS